MLFTTATLLRVRKALSAVPIAALLFAGLAGCSAIGPQPTEWVADTYQGAVYDGSSTRSETRMTTLNWEARVAS